MPNLTISEALLAIIIIKRAVANFRQLCKNLLSQQKLLISLYTISIFLGQLKAFYVLYKI